MLIVCPSCATCYDVEPASLLPEGRAVRCLRCRTVWQAETVRHANVESDSARRNVIPTTSAGVAGHPVHVNGAEGRERIASLDAFELIREQAHEALNAMRTRWREDHTRILNRLGAPDEIPPRYADKASAEAAPPPLQSHLPDAGWDANTRIKISRHFAETLADVANAIASRDGANELLDSEQLLRTGNEAGSFAAVVDDEQPADGEPSPARVDEAQEGGWMASAADKQNAAWAAAFAESPANDPNESTGLELPTPVDLDLEEPATAPVDLDVEDLSLAPTDLVEGRHCRDSLREEIQPVAKRRHRGRAGRWAPTRWPMSRLQTAILVLLAVDCILVGWRPEIVAALPQTNSFYKLVGLSVNLRGLGFDGVVTTMEQHEGIPVLVIEGKIVNGARTVADVPPLKFILRNANRQEIYAWTAVPSRTLLPPGEAVSFRTELPSPPPDTHDVFLRFVDHRDIVAAER